MDENEPRPVVVEREKQSHTGIIVGVVIAVLVILFLLFGLPYMMGGNDTNVEVTPTPTTPPTGE